MCACSYQQVLWFDVSVYDVHSVQVLDGSGQVEHHGAGVSLAVLCRGSDGVEQISTLNKQRHENNTFVVFHKKNKSTGVLATFVVIEKFFGFFIFLHEKQRQQQKLKPEKHPVHSFCFNKQLKVPNVITLSGENRKKRRNLDELHDQEQLSGRFVHLD